LQVKDAIKLLQTEMKQQQGNGLEALIIDLRGNPGGPMVAALDVASLFLRRGTVLIQLVSSIEVVFSIIFIYHFFFPLSTKE
jgi:C-terminal processing protease CtpA/Prc